MNDLLENVERAAAAKFGNPGTTEEVQVAAIVAKTIAEANKAKVDALRSNSRARHQIQRKRSGGGNPCSRSWPKLLP